MENSLTADLIVREDYRQCITYYASHNSPPKKSGKPDNVNDSKNV